MIIVIPAYEPDKRLPQLISDLSERLAAKLLIVDDGSGSAYAGIFQTAEALGAQILIHKVNQGKGAALKTAFAYIQENWADEDIIVTADSDGQHLPGDIERVAQAAGQSSTSLVLGSRAFVGQVPLRSRLGNRVTAKCFALATGQAISDTQTGLRGFSRQHLPWLLSLSGQRFEYEFNMLLQARRAGYQLLEVPIDTVYLDGNKSSHFRPVRDSLMIYAPFLHFVASSGAAALLDVTVFFLLMLVTNNLLLSVCLARLLSAGLQYVLNARLVFGQSQSKGSLIRYCGLVLLILVCNYLMMQGLVALGLAVVLAKVLTELILFLASYRLQDQLVFA